MPTIGSFSQGDLFGEEGTLEIPTLTAKIKFVPLRERSDKQPDLRIERSRYATRGVSCG